MVNFLKLIVVEICENFLRPFCDNVIFKLIFMIQGRLQISTLKPKSEVGDILTCWAS